MSEHRIRSASIGDAPGVCNVVRRSITECCVAEHHNDPKLLSAWLSNKTVASAEAWIRNADSTCLVVEQEGALTGFAMASNKQLLLCYVVPEKRFEGTGKALLRALEAAVVAQGVSILRLESTRTAEDFYRRNGYEVLGPRRAASGLSGLSMAKTLGPSVKNTA